MPLADVQKLDARFLVDILKYDWIQATEESVYMRLLQYMCLVNGVKGYIKKCVKGKWILAQTGVGRVSFQLQHWNQDLEKHKVDGCYALTTICYSREWIYGYTEDNVPLKSDELYVQMRDE